MIDETDNLDGLPKRFSYIRDVALKYGINHVITPDDPMEKLNAEQLKEIAEVYEKMAQQGDAPTLSAWIEQQSPHMSKIWNDWYDQWAKKNDNGEVTPPEPPIRPRAKGLFNLFKELARQRIAPFTSGKVDYSPPPPVYDWGKLPPGLSYLRDAAMRWGGLQFYEQRDELADRMTPAEAAEMKKFAKRLRASGDEERANKWTSDYDLLGNHEVAQVYWLLDTLQEFVPPDGSPGLYERRRDNPFAALDENS